MNTKPAEEILQKHLKGFLGTLTYTKALAAMEEYASQQTPSLELTKEQAYQKATLQSISENPNGTRQDVIYLAMDIYARQFQPASLEELKEKFFKECCYNANPYEEDPPVYTLKTTYETPDFIWNWFVMRIFKKVDSK